MAERVGPYTTQAGQRRRLPGLIVWAEDGVILVHDTVDDVMTVLNCKTVRGHVRARSEEADVWDKRASSEGDMIARAYAIEKREALRRFAEVMRDTLHDALEQGDPNDDNVRRRKLTEFLRGRRTGLGGRKETLASIESFLNPQAAGDTRGKVVFGPSTGAVSWTGGKDYITEPPPLPPGVDPAKPSE